MDVARRTLERGSIEQYQAVGWHPDGKQILFVGRRKGEGPQLFRQNISGGPPVAALPASFTILSICLSPDGRFIVAEGVGGKLYRAPLEGGEAVPLPGLTADDIPLLWSADGRSLYVSRMRGLPAALTTTGFVTLFSGSYSSCGDPVECRQREDNHSRVWCSP